MQKGRTTTLLLLSEYFTRWLGEYSLSVSPNPSHPWFAITTKELLQVYDYETQELKSQLNIGTYLF